MRKNNCMDISRYKRARLHTRRPGRSRKENFKRETDSLLIVAQNNTITTNFIEAKTDYTKENSKSKLCGERDEMDNQVISECSEQSQRNYKTRYGWVKKRDRLGIVQEIKVLSYYQMAPGRPGFNPLVQYQRLKNGTWCLLAYKVGIKGKVEQSRERNSALPCTLV